jgi:NAD(P)-dependent dehydrogenase (short-subunit alcohol dehydrogenase family)
MRILVVGATGTIGKAVVAALESHDLVLASRHKAHEKIDLADTASIEKLYKRVGQLDAVVSAAGQAAWKPLADLTDKDFVFSLRNKLMGQVNLVRYGVDSVSNGGSFTLTSGVLAQHPQPNSAAVSTVNAGLEGFVRAAALELPRGMRVNVVSPPWVSETLEAMGQPGTGGLPAATVAKSYVDCVEGTMTAQVIEPR